MKRGRLAMIPSFRLIATVILSLGMIILGGLNVQQQRSWVPPVDGVSWIDNGAGGVEAEYVEAGGPGQRAGLETGDILLAIDDRPVGRDLQVTQILYDLGVWAQASYRVLRGGREFQTMVVVAPRSDRVLNRLTYLEIVGILYLLIGLLVISRRWRAPHATHFYFVCIVSFVLYVFHATGKFNDFDWAIHWSDLVASVLLPPLFMHFCLEFPHEGTRFRRRTKTLLPLLYLPGALLLLAEVGFVLGAPDFGISPIALRDGLYAVNDFHFGLYFVLSASILAYTARRARDAERRQQMKWVTRGTAVAVLPYFAFQSVPRVLGMVPPPSADIALFSLVLIPMSFAWAMHRYRLMDVDILFKRGAVYTLTGLLVVGLYVSLVVLIGDLFGEGLPQLGSVGRVLATIVAALLFAPIRERVESWLDRFFYKERYDLRVTVSDFGRSLGSEKDLGRVLDRIVERLSGSLSVDTMAVLIEDSDDPRRFVLARSQGLELPVGTVFPFLKKGLSQPYVFSDGSDAATGLHYFIPCRAKGRIIAYLGMGRTRHGDYLSSEDIDLLEGVSEYVGIAVENAGLYESLEVKAIEYESLKDFNESIIESIGVGVMAEVDGRIIAWNRALETLTGHPRAEVIGRDTEAVIPRQSLERLRSERNLYKHRWEDLVVNFSATPLLDKRGWATGRLIIVDDITERVRLEDQLVQNDKLSSMGLLAAGVAHEVNTPLAVISSYSQLLRKQLSGDDERSRLTDRIIRQTFRASEIVNNLLNFSRTNATEFVELDVHQVIVETLTLLDHQLRSAGITIERDLSAEVPLAFGNAGKMQQVFLNLFLNARDAMTEGGILTVTSETRGAKLQVRVGDTGIGISQENIRKIYDPFFTTKERGKGTGLGLSVSYGIIQEHGGNVFVESAPGEGTTFCLELPLARKPVTV